VAATPLVDLPGAADHEGSCADMEQIAAVLVDATCALDAAGVPYVIIGGMASALLGRRRCSSDVDLLVPPEFAGKALSVLESEGFRTEKTNPHWLYKAFRDSVLVDILFKTKGDIYLDSEMLERARTLGLQGRGEVRVISPEDLLVIKALAFDEETPRHWYDALGLISAAEMDWRYVMHRARKGSRRVLSLLIYATSVDLNVPLEVICEMFEDCFEPAARGGAWAPR
jgi:predicted nucleotidyltransferase